jgi:hypothetical protein
MDWAEGFYSTTGRWWGAAESGITQRDHDRVALVRAFCGSEAVTMLELGSGYRNTAAAAARDGFRVTGVDISRAPAVKPGRSQVSCEPGSRQPRKAASAQPGSLVGLGVACRPRPGEVDQHRPPYSSATALTTMPSRATSRPGGTTAMPATWASMAGLAAGWPGQGILVAGAGQQGRS